MNKAILSNVLLSTVKPGRNSNRDIGEKKAELRGCHATTEGQRGERCSDLTGRPQPRGDK